MAAAKKPSSKAKSPGRKSADVPHVPPKSHAAGKKRRGKAAATAHLRQTVSRNIAGRKRAERDRRQSQRELAIWNRISQVFLTVIDDEMYAEVLNVVLDVLESEYGVFGYIDEDGAFVVPSMTRHVWDKCQVPGKNIIFPRETWGDSTWVWAIREKRAIHSNDPSTNVPTGHVPIRRHISMPITHQGEVVGLFQVANKESDYGEEDLRLLGTIAGHVAPILAARLQRDRQKRLHKQSEEALRKRVKELACLQRIRDGLQAGLSVEQACRNIVEYLAQGMQYPEIAVPVITLDGRRFTSGRSPEGLTHVLHADIAVAGDVFGRLSVFYTEDKPFLLPEEQNLVDAVAKILGQWLVLRRAEGEAQTLKTQIEFILGATKTGLDIIDADFNIRYIDPEWQKVYGNYTGRKCYEYFMGRSDPCQSCGVVKALKDKTVVVTEEVLPRENSRPIQVTTIPFQTDAGEWLVAETNVDITDRKRMEDELRHLAFIVHQAAEGIAVADLEGNLQFVNDTWARMHGYGAGAELVGCHLSIFHTDEQLKTDVIPFNEVVIRRGHNTGEVGHMRKDGTTFPAQMITTLLKDEQGEPYGIAGFAQDITDRKQSEEALRESETKFRTVFDGAADGMFAFDLESRKFVISNAACSRMLGFTPEEFRDLSVADLHLPEDLPLISEQIGMFLKGEAGRRKDVRFKRRDGSTFFTDLNPTLISLGGRRSILVAIRDITDRKQAEEQVKAYQQRLRSLGAKLAVAEEQERRRIAGDLHDDVGQGLAVAKMKVDLARKSPPCKNCVEFLQEIADLINEAVYGMGVALFDLYPPALNELGLEAATERLTQRMQEKFPDLRLAFETDRRPKPLSQSVRGTLFRATRELLLNAVRHAQAKKVRVSMLREGDNLRISVEDNGSGFDPDLVFKQAGVLSGFGLFNIRERMEYLGGRLEIDSRLGRGTLASLTLLLGGE